MKAIGFRQYGGADVLEELTISVPDIKPDRVRVKVTAAAINPGDALFRSGALKNFLRLKLPFVPGLDIAGTVDQVGSKVTRFQVGDKVYGMLPNMTMGGYGQYAVIDAAALAPIPSQMSFIHAAAIPCAALTALQALRDLAHVTPGCKVLINGASGGVGSFAVQIARVLGADVTAVTSTRNLEFVSSLGANTVIDYSTHDPAGTVSRYDVVFDAVGVKSFAQWKTVLKPGGIMVTVNFGYGNPLALLRAKFDPQRRKLKSLLVKPRGSDLERLGQWYEEDKLRVMVEKTFPFQKAAEAHQQIETKRTRGKLVLIIDQDEAS
ncbi:MAG: NAD(P)-dependent alcohol dehydrogenase [bacterium]|nr:NAD(P)-dependent alcohol dehydrogenase [bacterium]